MGIKVIDKESWGDGRLQASYPLIIIILITIGFFLVVGAACLFFGRRRRNLLKAERVADAATPLQRVRPPTRAVIDLSLFEPGQPQDFIDIYRDQAGPKRVLLGQPGIANPHARIRFDAAERAVYLQDMTPEGGTMVNSAPLSTLRRPLRSGDVVTLAGLYAIRFEIHG